MSLQIWLPLTKDLRQQGLSDVTVTNNGATFNSAGKLGGCYYFNRSASNYLKIDNPLTSNTNGISMAFWVKLPSNGSVNDQLVHIGNGSGWTNNRFTCFVRGGNSTLIFCCGDGTNSTQYNCVSSALTLNQWTHVTCVYKSNKMMIYLNGNLNKEYNTNIAPSFTNVAYIGVGAGPNVTEPATAYLNDIRIYDHALSQMEVKELAKGLVLHYPLDKNSTYTSLVDKTANYTIYNNFSVPASLTATGEQYLGSPVRRLSMTPDSSHLSNFKTSLGSHGVYGWRQTFAASTKYVFWIYYKPISHMDVRVGGTASNINGWTEIPPKAVGDGWYVVGQYRKGTVTEAKTDNIFVSFYSPSAQADIPIQIDFACPTLIQGLDEMQPSVNWSSGSIIYDNSGFCNNGIINNTLSTTEDTPKYSASTNFSGTSYVSLVPPTSEVLTMAVWANWKTIPSGQSVILVDNGSGIGLGLMSTGILCSTSKAGSSYTFSKSNLVANTWYHFVVVKTGTTARKLYINGVEQTATSNTSNWTFAVNELQLGKRSTTSDGFAGKLCDFRAYATALSADDVKSLYQNCATIDSDGTIRGQIRS